MGKLLGVYPLVSPLVMFGKLLDVRLLEPILVAIGYLVSMKHLPLW